MYIVESEMSKSELKCKVNYLFTLWSMETHINHQAKCKAKSDDSFLLLLSSGAKVKSAK